MLNLFQYKDNEVIVCPEALLLEPIKKIWNRDKSKNKKTAMKELGFIYFYADPRSDYNYITNESEKIQSIVRGEGLSIGFEIDKDLQTAIDFYNSFKSIPVKLVETLLQTAQKYNNYINELDFNERDAKGRPLYSPNAIQSMIDKSGDYVMKYLDMEKNIFKKLEEDKYRARGQKDLGIADNDGVEFFLNNNNEENNE
ncbi:MAG: hypothetical protein LBM05_00615 [Endomicrobium sp.]|jgi:hypothetical protein|nr:hypothetical protein [Endomicrobium sp.]